MRWLLHLLLALLGWHGKHHQPPSPPSVAAPVPQSVTFRID